MKLLIKGVQIIDKNSRFNGKKKDILIERGKIKVSPGKVSADNTIDANGMILTPGWVDMWCWLADPGYEHKENIQTGLDAASAGGFTGIAVLPNNDPVTQSKNDVAYLRKSSSDFTEIYPIASVTRETEGKELTEMIDLHTAGAKAFSDGLKPIWHSDILLKSLQYLQKFDGLLINRAEDVHLNQFGTMHEGVQSTMLGMKGMPALSESLMINRDLDLLRYAGGKIHFSLVSTAESLKLIRKAKKAGLKVTCDMASYQTDFLDEDLQSFDTRLKVNPPFRGKADRKALVKGLMDDSIDVIVSSHIPQDEESKKLEFDLAEFGILGFQTLAANLVSLSKDVPMEKLLDKVSIRPREILGIEVPVIDDGEMANLTLFDPNKEWVFDDKSSKSLSKNSPYWRKTLKGKAVAVIIGTSIQIQD